MATSPAVYISGYSCGLRDKNIESQNHLCKWNYDSLCLDLCWTCACYLTEERLLKYLGFSNSSSPKIPDLKSPTTPISEGHGEINDNKNALSNTGNENNANLNTVSSEATENSSNQNSDSLIQVTQEDGSTWLLSLIGEDRFESVLCGWRYTAAVTQKGICFLWKDTEFEKPFMPSDAQKITVATVCLGDKHSTLISRDGKAFELMVEETCYTLNPLMLPLPVTQVSCGKEHVLLLTDAGTVYSYGLGSRGQLGHESLNSEDTPRLIEALEGITVIGIAAGGWHSAALDNTGSMYFWGWNESGQLGLLCSKLNKDIDHSKITTIQAVPMLINLPQESLSVKKISLGSRHSAAVTDEGDLWTWGWNGYGQLCLNDTQTRDKPTQVKFFKSRNIEVTDIRCRDWITIIWVSSKQQG